MGQWETLDFMIDILQSNASGLQPCAQEGPLENIPGQSIARRDGLQRPKPNRGGILGEFIRDAPVEFCCALDSRLMMDPVRTPCGHVFEREVLAHALPDYNHCCPLSGTPLTLDDCVRLPELRRSISQWVRGRQPCHPRPSGLFTVTTATC